MCHCVITKYLPIQNCVFGWSYSAETADKKENKDDEQKRVTFVDSLSCWKNLHRQSVTVIRNILYIMRCIRVVHGLGWIGLGWVEIFQFFCGLGWVRNSKSSKILKGLC